MTPRELAVEVENAFDYRDRTLLLRSLGQLVAQAEAHKLTSQPALAAAPKPPPIEPTD